MVKVKEQPWLPKETITVGRKRGRKHRPIDLPRAPLPSVIIEALPPTSDAAILPWRTVLTMPPCTNSGA